MLILISNTPSALYLSGLRTAQQVAHLGREANRLSRAINYKLHTTGSQVNSQPVELTLYGSISQWIDRWTIDQVRTSDRWFALIGAFCKQKTGLTSDGTIFHLLLMSTGTYEVVLVIAATMKLSLGRNLLRPKAITYKLKSHREDNSTLIILISATIWIASAKLEL